VNGSYDLYDESNTQSLTFKSQRYHWYLFYAL